MIVDNGRRAAPDAPSPGRGPGLAAALRRFRSPESELLLATVLVALLFAADRASFLRLASIESILLATAFVGIIAVGECVLLLAGEFDLSVGTVAGMVMVVSAKVMVATGGDVLAGVLAGIAVGVVVGLVNAALVVVLGLPSFVTTIGMQFIAIGMATYLTGGAPIYDLPPAFTAFGFATPLDLSWMFFAFVGLGIVADLVVRFTPAGRRLVATGGDPAVAAIAGIRPGLVKAVAFVVCATCAAAAGVLQLASSGTSPQQVAGGVELTVVAAAVIGGTSLFGGSGSPLGAVIGVLFITVVTFGVQSAGLAANWQALAVGAILLVAIWADVARRRARTRRS